METPAIMLPAATTNDSPSLPVVNATSREDTIGYVHSVETCGTVDGPGLRYVLFLGGCPLRCLYCHNPDAQGRPRGKETTAGEALEDVLRYRNFIRDGGLTISGGEPLLQAEFVTAMFAGAKQAGLHTALDTSGFRGDRASDLMLANTDLVLLDIKSFLPDTYKRVTGVSIDSTLEFARRLQRHRIEVWIRFVLVPGLTDDEANIAGVARFVASLDNVNRVKVLPFHKLGEHKYADLGIDYQLASTPPATPEQVNRAREIFQRNGVKAR
jgi:pyruvate formate lyase activating enzyme